LDEAIARHTDHGFKAYRGGASASGLQSGGCAADADVDADAGADVDADDTSSGSESEDDEEGAEEVGQKKKRARVSK
jgi:hypothetical protein